MDMNQFGSFCADNPTVSVAKEILNLLSPNRHCAHPEDDSRMESMLEDETIYSLCARIGHNALVRTSATSMWLLGHPYGARHHDVLYGLSQLEARYGGARGDLVIDEFTARTRTVLGGVMPFLAPADREVVIQAIRRPRGSSGPSRMLELRGTMSGLGTALRRCAVCAAADCDRVGFAYWHAVHQLPGVWACPWHARPLQWLLQPSPKTRTWFVAHRPDADFQELKPSDGQLDLLQRLAAAAVWCACQWSLGVATLPILVRSRLHARGLLRQEGFATEAEQRQIHERIAGPLAQSGAPSFEGLRSPEWVGKTLVYTEFSHPLRWATLIASTLTERERLQPLEAPGARETLTRTQALCQAFRVATPATLDRDHALAWQRTSQLELFPDRRGPRRRLAPADLYEALGEGWRLAQAAQSAGLTTSQASAWVRKDMALAVHWHDSIARLRTDEARSRIERHLDHNPCALRSQILLKEVASVRALERYAPELLERLLPPVQGKFSKQRALTF